MKLRKLFRIKKPRKYPIKRDREGLSLRARCFEQFDQGKRPLEVSKELRTKETTAFRYFRDWKRLGPDFDKRYSFVKKLLNKDAPDRESNVEIFSRMLGIEKEEFEAILSQSHGLKRFMTGKLYFPTNEEADHKRSIALLLAILISDHFVKNGGKFEDIYYTFQRWMKENKEYREEEDADIEEDNKTIALIHKILAAAIKQEREGRVKPDVFSREERDAIMRYEIQSQYKQLQEIYWKKIAVLRLEGLTEQQAREKKYQDLVGKGDEKRAKIFRQFQDRIHPVQLDD